jgi:hypothetical protein
MHGRYKVIESNHNGDDNFVIIINDDNDDKNPPIPITGLVELYSGHGNSYATYTSCGH